ncbi:MAG: hypothetical protein L6R19_13690 [Alphaproteobacteria bacterium]|nr:hypothetical protein [Alphaproteobacteria bacterium]
MVIEKPARVVPLDPRTEGHARRVAPHDEAWRAPLGAEMHKAVSGRLQLVSLDHVRARLGESWPRHRALVQATTLKILRQYLAGQAIFEPVNDTTFAVLFEAGDTRQARAICLMILRAVTRILLGEDDPLEESAVRTIVAAADGTLSLRTDEPAAGPGAADAPPHSSAESALPASLPAELLKLASLVPDDLDFLYRPIWDTKRSAITTYLCQAVSVGDGDEPVVDYAVLPGGVQSSVVREVDLRAAKRIADDLGKIVSSGRRVFVSTTVHCRTLEDRESRQAYVDTFAPLSEETRRLLAFEIVGFDDTTSESRRHISLSAVKSLGRVVVARLPIDVSTLASFQRSGFDAVGVYLDERNRDERRLMKLFERFASMASRIGLRTFVHGMRSSSLATIAMAAGFDHVDGEVVALSADRIGAVMRFQLADLYGAGEYADIP